ncbi:Ribonuclease P protein component [Pseudohaliea rubra DSM 19751]|uniref:Ribonuclease P protein component n=1 Tax=Pseudohaliea rubra DSM 19751 TaxID=1265313 RepID=A0A095VTL9_9GAMM|nr:Ribonuclease P protein component [Pseudohaliea rubra DSM 19751]
MSVKAGQREFLLLARPSEQSHHRLGLAVAKKHVARAVRRNRIKRIARECFRHLPTPTVPLDIVFLTRPGAGDLDKVALARGIDRQFRRLLERATA